MKIENLTHTYSAGTPFERRAVDGVNLEVAPGEFLGVIGHTGSGKSTFIQHLNGLLAPTSGTVLFDGEDIHRSKAATRDVRFHTSLGYSFTDFLTNTGVIAGISLVVGDHIAGYGFFHLSGYDSCGREHPPGTCIPGAG